MTLALGRIYSQVPHTFYECADGTFSDHNGPGAGNWHGGLKKGGKIIRLERGQMVPVDAEVFQKRRGTNSGEIPPSGGQAQSEFNEAKKALDAKRNELIARNASPDQLANILATYEGAVTAANRKLNLVAARRNQVSEAGRNQTNIFAGVGYLHTSDPAIQWTGKGDQPYDPRTDPRKPTYEVLPDYGAFFTLGKPKSHFEADGGLTETVSVIKLVASQYRYQTEPIAAYLKTGTLEADAYHVWHWLKTNVNYRLDEPGREQIRTPNRSWHDRVRGVDCEDLAVFGHTILSNMGYTPRFEIVAFYGQKAYGHIFLSVSDGVKTWVVDDVMGAFNKRPDNITSTMIIERLSGLAGLDGNSEPGAVRPQALCGLGATVAPDAVTRRLMDAQSALIAESMSGLAGPGNRKALRKVRFAILLNGTPDRDIVTQIMPYVDDINHAGNLVYKRGTDLGALEAMMDGLEADQLDGLGRKGKAQRQAAKTVRKAARVEKKAVKTTAKVASKTAKVAKKTQRKAAGKGVVRKVGKTAKKVGKALVKYNPVTVVIRNAFLLSMRTNIPRLASRLKYSYLTPEQAASKRLDRVEYGKLVKQRGKIEKLFTAIGGRSDAMKMAVLKGGKGLSGGVNYLDTFQPSNLDLAGLGVAPAAGVAAAAPILTAAAKLLSEVDFKVLFAKSDIREEDASVAEFAEDQVAAETAVRPQNAAVNSLIDVLPEPPANGGGEGEGESIRDYAPMSEEAAEMDPANEPTPTGDEPGLEWASENGDGEYGIDPEVENGIDPESDYSPAMEADAELGSLVTTLTSLAAGVKAARATGSSQPLKPVLARRPERNRKKKKLGDKIRSAVATVRAKAQGKPKPKVTAQNKGYQSNFEQSAVAPAGRQTLVPTTPPSEKATDNTALLVGGGVLLLLALAGRNKK